ncbi:MAG: enoyl-CoA hydratase/isomerase family protein [Phycisphaerales bacterium]|nr:enoyl-CoA hydratase/isomerase family protein [Phycisphaerales bacterium]
MTDLATLTVNGSVATLSMDRPEARNAMSLPLLDALHARLDEMPEGPHVLVLTGSGKSFCAGMDLKSVLGDESAPPKLLHSIAKLTTRLRTLPMVVVAKVNGAAVGGGCGLACACDVVVSHADAKLGFPEVDLGVCPAVVAPMLVRKIGAGPARVILLRGGLMSGTRAHEAGIVDELANSREDLDTLCNSVVERLASGGAHAIAATKALLTELDGSGDAELAARGADLSASVLATPEARERLAAQFATR